MSSIVKFNIYKRGHVGYISYDELEQNVPGVKTGCFYAINPMYTPIPSYTKLICVDESNQGKDGFGIGSIETVYDPFENRQECTYFITWTAPTPYTTPLYLYESSGSILPSFEIKKEMKEMKQSFLSPIYVLTDKPMKNTIFPADKKQKWFKGRKKKNGQPEFRFKSYMGRCIPDPGGVKLEECTLEHDFDLVKPLSLTDYLGEREKREEREEGREENGENIFEKIGNIWVSVIIGIFLGLLGVIIFKKSKRK